jgi:hypothetical protein
VPHGTPLETKVDFDRSSREVELERCIVAEDKQSNWKDLYRTALAATDADELLMSMGTLLYPSIYFDGLER